VRAALPLISLSSLDIVDRRNSFGACVSYIYGRLIFFRGSMVGWVFVSDHSFDRTRFEGENIDEGGRRI
jgi:hypothetical protein